MATRRTKKTSTPASPYPKTAAGVLRELEKNAVQFLRLQRAPPEPGEISTRHGARLQIDGALWTGTFRSRRGVTGPTRLLETTCRRAVLRPP